MILVKRELSDGLVAWPYVRRYKKANVPHSILIKLNQMYLSSVKLRAINLF